MGKHGHMTSLTPQQLAESKERLAARRSSLQAEIRAQLLRADDEQYAELAGRVHDEAEASVADLLADLSLAHIDHWVVELKSVETALLRMEMGDYGVCVQCGDAIDPRRLDAYPTAERCFVCQSMYEKTHAQLGRPTL